jgi:hypothetical protein
MENISSELKKRMEKPMTDEIIEIERIAIDPLYNILLNKQYTKPVEKNDYITAYT